MERGLEWAFHPYKRAEGPLLHVVLLSLCCTALTILYFPHSVSLSAPTFLQAPAVVRQAPPIAVDCQHRLCHKQVPEGLTLCMYV